MHPERQDLNIIFLHLGPVANWMGDRGACRPLGERQAPIFENFPIRHIFLKFYFFNIKMKKSPHMSKVTILYWRPNNVCLTPFHGNCFFKKKTSMINDDVFIATNKKSIIIYIFLST